MSIIGDNIRRCCLLKGIEYKDLAIKSGLALLTIYNLLNDRSNPTRTTLKLIADALDTTVEKLSDVNYGYKVEEICIERIVKNIRVLCLLKGMSYEDLAEVSGVSTVTINKLLKKEILPKISTIKKLADELSTSLEEVFFGDFYKKEEELSFQNVRKNLNYICMEKKISFTELEKKSGLAYQTICNVLTNNTLPRISTVRQLAEALGVTPYELMSQPVGSSSPI